MTTKVWGTSNDSILLTIKKLIGLDETNNAFDPDILAAINTAFFALHQIGIGFPSAFRITGDAETWLDIPGIDENFEGIKTYVHLRVRKLFDPPTSSMVMTAIDEQLKEVEWRLYFENEFNPNNTEGEVTEDGVDS